MYIHIPFCHARCGYCDFVTFTGKEDQREAYVAALGKEMELYSPVIASEAKQSPCSSETTSLLRRSAPRNDVIDTLFFGGGTPSVLDPSHLRAVFKALRENFAIDPAAEITLEANPESMTAERLDAWRVAGINRLSIGLQAYEDTLLKAMGRFHSVREFEIAYACARQAGFSNLNIDLIYGFPNQSLDDWKRTLRATLALHPEHLSLYALTVEEHTPFGSQGIEVDADLQGEMYDWARAYVSGEGYPQYEVSNFARPGKECRHNLIYWRGQDYIGLGVGAVGCVGGVRWENQKNLAAYYKDIQAERRPRLTQEAIDPHTQKFERLMLGLRLREGFSWETEEDPDWSTQRARLAAQGYLEETQPGRWRIVDRYVPLTNQILLPFLSA